MTAWVLGSVTEKCTVPVYRVTVAPAPSTAVMVNEVAAPATGLPVAGVTVKPAMPWWGLLGSTVTVVGLVVLPFLLTAVSVYVVVTSGLTATTVPVLIPTPLSMVMVSASATTQVRTAVPPGGMTPGRAPNAETTGAEPPHP